MNVRKWISSFALIVSVFAPLTALNAQGVESERIACDSTLATLLLLAEHNYQYLSSKMNPDTMDHPALSIELGIFQPIVDQVVMMSMRGGDNLDAEMTDEQRAANESLRDDAMAMTAPGAVNAYLVGMNMTAAEPFTELGAGNVADEAPECAAVRADVEQFVLAHLLTELSMMNAQGG